MSCVLVVDDMAVFREPISLALRQRGYDTQTAEDGLDALRQINDRKPDVILLDLAMPRMDGLTFLRTLRAHGRFEDVAVILLTAIGDRTKILEAAQLGVRDYLLKSRFSIDELCARIGKYAQPTGVSRRSAPLNDQATRRNSPSLNAADRPAPPDDEGAPLAALPDPPADPAEALRAVKPILSRSDVTDRIESAAELKAMSPIVGQLLKITASPNCSIQQVANTIRQDQAIALKVLKLANSSVYTRGEQVTSVQQAVTRIGLTQIREVVLNISVMDRFADPGIAAVLDSNDFWEHSIATGLIAAHIVRYRNGAEPEINAAFTMGLLHDVGRMVFVEQFPDEYLQVLETAERMALPLEQVESRMLLVNHADLMDKLLHLWNFSKALVDPIALHHLSLANARGLAPRTATEVAVLSLANRIAHAMLLGASGNNTVYPVSNLVDFLRLTDSQMHELEANIATQVHDMKFAMLTHAAEARQTPGVRQRVAAELAAPLRPLFVSAQSGFDAYRAFTAAVASRAGDEAPNLAVVHLGAASEREPVTAMLIEAEKHASVQSLPAIILSRKGNILLDDAAMVGRPHQLLATPTPISRFIRAANVLLDAGAQAAAA